MKRITSCLYAVCIAVAASGTVLLFGTSNVEAKNHQGHHGHYGSRDDNKIQAPGSAVIRAIDLGSNTITLGDRNESSHGRTTRSHNGGTPRHGNFSTKSYSPTSMAGVYRIDAFTKVILGSVERLGQQGSLSMLKVGQMVAVNTFGSDKITKIQILSDHAPSNGKGGKHGKHGKGGKKGKKGKK